VAGKKRYKMTAKIGRVKVKLCSIWIVVAWRENKRERDKEAKLITPTATDVPFSMKNATTHTNELLQYYLLTYSKE
jgi:hypothetical protein